MTRPMPNFPPPSGIMKLSERQAFLAFVSLGIDLRSKSRSPAVALLTKFLDKR